MRSEGNPAPLRTVDRVYSDLKRLVVNYDILPGQQIHIEDVSNFLTVSITPVREALNRLLNESLIQRNAGRGFYNRHLDINELKDLFQLRGSLVISALHILFSDDFRVMPKISAESHAPVCRDIIEATDNGEMMRVYKNVSERIGFIWDVYAASENGQRNIREYRAALRSFLAEENLSACIDTVHCNVRLQVRALDDMIREGLAKLFYKKPLPMAAVRR